MLRWLAFVGMIVILAIGFSALAIAQEDPPVQPSVAAASDEAAPPAPELDSGDISWMLVSIALVLMMTCPGLALFYGGLVRKKNILSVMMQCMFLMGLMSVAWAIVGYSLAFAPPLIAGFDIIGGFDHVLLSGVSPAVIGDGSPDDVAMDQITVAFQGMFFIIRPALICGAFAERMKFSTMAVFSVLWGLFVYCPIAHWVWSGTGWLSEFNEVAQQKYAAGEKTGFYFPAIDFAGGLVVHVSSGISALVCALLIGPRRGFPTEPMPPHNLTYYVHRYWSALGRMVWLQRGKCWRREWQCGQCRPCNSPRGICRAAWLVSNRVSEIRQSEYSGSMLGRNSRSGMHHAGSRFSASGQWHLHGISGWDDVFSVLYQSQAYIRL